MKLSLLNHNVLGIYTSVFHCLQPNDEEAANDSVYVQRIIDTLVTRGFVSNLACNN